MTKQDVLNNLNEMVGNTYENTGKIELDIIEKFEDFKQNEISEVFTSVNDDNIIAYINTEDGTEFMINFEETENYEKIVLKIDMWN